MANPVRLTDLAENQLNVQSDGPSLTAFTCAFDYDGNGNMIYQGWALSVQPGAGGAPSQSSATWAIRKYTYNGSNQCTLIQWANGTTAQNNVWNNRASLSYQ